jgi:lipopolysaccharide transport system permease protein
LLNSIQKLLRQRLKSSKKSDFRTKIELLKALIHRDLEAHYKGSILGNLWPAVHQLSQLLIYTYVFSVVLRVKLSSEGLPASNFTFGLWLFAGLLPWTAFVNGLTMAAGSVIGQPNLVKKVIFPIELLPLVAVISAFIESTFGLVILICLIAIFTQKIHITLWLLPLIWVPQLALTAGLSYLMAGITVFLRDIPQTLMLLLNLWFYLTPIVYPTSAIPENFRPWVLKLNPMAAIAEIYRDIILKGEMQHWPEWGVVSIVALAVLWIGFWCYQRLRSAFADVL